MNITKYSDVKNIRVLVQVLVNDYIERKTKNDFNRAVGDVLAKELIANLEKDSND